MAADFILETKGLTKEFKGFVAVNNVDLQVRRGTYPRADRPERRRQDDLLQPADEVPAAHRAAPSSSTARDITDEKPAQIARRGIVRSFQISAVFPHLTVLENVRVRALQRSLGTSFHFWRAEKSLLRLHDRARGAAGGGRPAGVRRRADGRICPTAASARWRSPRRWRWSRS